MRIHFSLIALSLVMAVSFTAHDVEATYPPTLTGGNRPVCTGTTASFVPWVEDLDLWESFTFQPLSQPLNGSASVINNKPTYTPTGTYTGIDSFTYQATDHSGGAISGTAAVRVYSTADLTNCKKISTVYTSGATSGQLQGRTKANLCTFYSSDTTRLTDTGTPVTMDYFINWPSSGAPPKAIVVLIGGGDLNMSLTGNTTTGVADSSGGGNFVVRSAQLFADAGYLAVAINKPSDQPPVNSSDTNADADHYRISVKHAVDILALLKHINTENLDLFIAGTSRGTISAVALNQIAAGISLSSSLTSDPNDAHVYIGKTGIANLQPEFVAHPVHVLWHSGDLCSETTPANSQALYDTLSQISSVPSTAHNIANGGVRVTVAGSNVTPDVCGAFDYHGYLGIEPTAVKYITDWLDTQVSALSGNHRPEAAFATIAAAGAPVQLNLSTLTRDMDGDPRSYTLSHTDTSLGGTVGISGSTVTYTPPVNVTTKTDYFVYVVTDGRGGVNAGVVTVKNGTHQLVAASVGNGTLSSATPGVSCSDNVCSALLSSGSTATITATAASGSSFTRWSGCDPSSSGNDCTVTLDTDKSVTATFVPTEQLTVNASGSGSGTVASTVGGINYSYQTTGSASATLNFSTPVIVTATASPTSNASWSGDCDSQGGTSSVAICTIAGMNSAKTVTANFSIRNVKNLNTSVYYDTILSAYAVAEVNQTILLHATGFTGDLLLNNPNAVTLKGGYDADYTTNSRSYTTISGKVTVNGGKVVVENIAVK